MYKTKVLTFILLNIAFVASERTNSSIKAGTQQKYCNTTNIVDLKKSAKDVSNKLRQCLDETLNTYLGSSNSSLKCKTISHFNDSLKMYRTTYKDECGKIVNNTDIFLKTVNKTLGNNDFKDLYENRQCFEGVNTKITECIKDSLGHNNVSLGLLEKVNSVFEYNVRSCDSTKKLKNCTLSVLNASCNKTVPYMSTAFDDVLKNCEAVFAAANTNVTPPSKPNIIIYVGASLAAIIGLIIIIVFVKKIINNKKKADCTIKYSPNNRS